MRRCKDAAPAAAASASASAKIAPAQLQEEEAHGGGKEQEFCDKCCSALSGAGGAEEEEAATTAEGDREWVAEPEPGVLLTLAPLASGVTNRLLRIRFREEVFDAWAAQCWWADNHDRIAELYSLVQPDADAEAEEEAAEAMLPVTPCQSEAEEEEAGAESSPSQSTSTFSGGPSSSSCGGSTGTLGSPILGLVTAPNTNTGAAAAAAGPEHGAVHDQPTAAPWREWLEEQGPLKIM